jgi:hypothetical protein
LDDNFFKKAAAFNQRVEEMFDIFCQDPVIRKQLELRHGVKMSDMEWAFLADQKDQKKMFCEDFVDRQWMKTMERRKRDLETLEKMRDDAKKERELNQPVASIEDSETSAEEGDQGMAAESSFSDAQSSQSSCDETPTPDECRAPKKLRLSSTATITQSGDELPLQFQHIRESIRKVRPEFYETVDKLKSCYHMSEAQAEAAVITVGNRMFDRNWKEHDKAEVIDLDTLPESSSVRQAGKSIEVLALDEIVKEIMNSDEHVVVTHVPDDGSKKQGAGSFSVQGITVNGKYRSLPTMSIAAESRRNLADLKVAVFEILEAASCVASKDLFEKIDFVITDQTAHNFHVDELVAESLHSEHVPDHLFCNVHPTLMFNRVVTKQWAEIENTLGRDKIYSNFLVNATTTATSVTEQGWTV